MNTAQSPGETTTQEDTFHLQPPRNLQEAFNLTLDFEKEYQITQPQTDFTTMETYYEEPTTDDAFMTEEVQMRSQNQQQGQYQQGNWPQHQKQQYQ